MNRRSSNDEQWQKLKKECKERDGGKCRCCSILLPWEWKERQEQSDFRSDMTLPTDVAHCEPVSLHLDKVYDINNVFFFFVDGVIVILIIFIVRLTAIN